MINVKLVFTSDQLVHSLITDKHTQQKMYFTAVYGLHSIETRKPLWNTIYAVAASLLLSI